MFRVCSACAGAGLAAVARSGKEWDFQREKLDDGVAKGGAEAALENERWDGFLVRELERREPLHDGEQGRRGYGVLF